VFKRTRWLAIGAVAGSAGTVWAQRKVREQMDRTKPAHLASVAADATRRVGAVVRDAVSEGRQAASVRESELRGRMPPRPLPPRPTAPRLRAVPER
jgi:hypothetical protein